MAAAPTPGQRSLARRFGRALETYIALPLFALLPLAALWLTTFHVIDAERRAAVDAARDAAREQVDTYEAQMARNLNAIDQTLKVVKYAVELNGARAALPALRGQGLLPPGLVFQVSVADRDGKVVDSNPASGMADVAAESCFKAQQREEGGDPCVSQTRGEPAAVQAGRAEAHLRFTRRINDGYGRFAGIAIVEVDPAYFTSSYERSREGELGLLALVGSDGVARALRIGEQVSWGQRIALTSFGEQVTLPHPTAPDNVARYASVRRLHGFPLSVVVGLAEREQMAQYQQHRRNYLAAAWAGSALLVALVAMISAWSWQLAKARRRERRAQETYAAASEASLDAVFVLRTVAGPDGAIADFLVEHTNSRAEQLTGIAKNAMIGRMLGALMPFYRTNGMFEQLLRVVAEGKVMETEWQAQTGPAAGHWLQRQFVPVEGGAVAMVRDITERKRTEERIRHMAHHDELTGLPNRSLIRDRLDEAIRNASAPTAAWRWYSSTWTASSSSTTAWATTPATSCCRSWADGCRPACAAPTRWAAWAATNS